MRTVANLFSIMAVMLCLSCADSDVSPNLAPGGNNVGSGGSLARFTIAHDKLYIVDNYTLKAFSLSEPMRPKAIDSLEIGWGTETIFGMGDSILFIGTQLGMHILSIKEDGSLEFLSTYEHIVSCDPVVAQDTLAYVTLRSENLCEQGADVLEVVDIRDLLDPQLIYRQPMINPHGLGISDTLLFVTEGLHGLKIFDINSPTDLEEITFLQNVHLVDVIPRSNLLIATGSEGIYQFDYSDPKNLKLLSLIPIAQK